jgi:hypothetical protein
MRRRIPHRRITGLRKKPGPVVGIMYADRKEKLGLMDVRVLFVTAPVNGKGGASFK